jgi:hypothetical protein
VPEGLFRRLLGIESANRLSEPPPPPAREQWAGRREPGTRDVLILGDGTEYLVRCTVHFPLDDPPEQAPAPPAPAPPEDSLFVPEATGAELLALDATDPEAPAPQEVSWATAAACVVFDGTTDRLVVLDDEQGWYCVPDPDVELQDARLVAEGGWFRGSTIQVYRLQDGTGRTPEPDATCPGPKASGGAASWPCSVVVCCGDGCYRPSGPGFGVVLLADDSTGS